MVFKNAGTVPCQTEYFLSNEIESEYEKHFILSGVSK